MSNKNIPFPPRLIKIANNPNNQNDEILTLLQKEKEI